MGNVVSCIKSIHRIFQGSISLCLIFFCLGIFFIQRDCSTDPVIHKSMTERNFCLFIIGITELERISIFLISDITSRSLDFFYIIRKSHWKICFKCCFSISTSNCSLNQSIFFYRYFSICCFHILCCKQGKIPSRKCIVSIFVFLYHLHHCFLTIICKSSL